MIESFMYFGIGFLLAALSVFVVVPLVHGRAVRLTTRRLTGAVPSSIVEVVADKDSLRAEFAISTRHLETNLQQLNAKSASQLAELGRKGDAINRLKIELGELRVQTRAAEEDFAVKAAALHEAERALSEKEAGLTKRMRELDQRSTLVDAQKIEIIALKTQVEALKAQLDRAPHELKGLNDRRAALHEAERALSEKEARLAERTRELDQRSTLVDAQKIEIIALKTQLEALKQQLDGATHELKAVEDRRATEHLELKAATRKLVEERSKFEDFHDRVVRLVEQLMAQSTADKTLSR